LAGNLERLNEGPEQSADAFAATEQFDKPHDSEQTEEVDADDCRAARLHQHQQQQQHHTTVTYTAHTLRRVAQSINQSVRQTCLSSKQSYFKVNGKLYKLGDEVRV